MALELVRSFEGAIIPNYLASLVFRKKYIYEFKELQVISAEDRVGSAIDIFGQLGNEWAVDFFKAWKEGGVNGTKNYLREQGVYENGRELKRPKNVFPGMEMTNFDPKAHPELAKEMAALTNLFFAEFGFIHKTLTLGGKPLLLMEFMSAVIRELRNVKFNNGSDPVYLEVGQGDGRGMVDPLKAGMYSAIAVDHEDAEMVKDLIGRTFLRHGLRLKIITLGNNGGVDRKQVEDWRRQGFPQTVFVAGGIDVTIPGALDGLKGMFNNISLAGNNYVIHEQTPEAGEVMIRNMSGIAEKVIIIDGIPSRWVLDVQLGVFSRLEKRGIHVPLDLYAAVASALLSPPDIDLQKMGKEADPNKDWFIKQVPNFPRKPFVGHLQHLMTGYRRM